MIANLPPTIATFGSSHLRRRRFTRDCLTAWPAASRSTAFRRTIRRHRGYTLIESLVSIALLAVILTVTTLTLHTMVRADRRIRDELNCQSEFDRLATQLRSDAHPALAVTTIDGQVDTTTDTLQLTLPDSQAIQYALSADRVERTLRREDKIEHRETFRLPPSPSVQWQVKTEGPTSMVSLVLEPQPMSELGGPTLPYAYRIDAAVHLISPQPISPEL